MRPTTLTDFALPMLIHPAWKLKRCASVADAAAAHGILENRLMKVAHLHGQPGYANTRCGG